MLAGIDIKSAVLNFVLRTPTIQWCVLLRKKVIARKILLSILKENIKGVSLRKI